ncbi:exo-beta-N-acetylmuramidase NamZ domain-containing protein [Paenarthrobacter sp. NPDC056912]|uniref:exo-beta-N-acetylmuramidase NamZ family protein n=1 Tax=Paenarthrobacter sp. NPDC056912 TaxID=3345965 RepID=UPI003670245A
MTIDRRRLIRASGLGAAAALAAPLASITNAQATPALDAGKPGSPVNGADVAAANKWNIFAGRKVGVITNPTGVLANLRSIVDDMADKGVNVGAVFGPEHGFRGTAQDGASEGTSVDPRTGITVYDSYGAEVADYAGYFKASGVDTICFDIQDVGARFYTYIWTMWGAMQAASQTGAKFVVLDRPNPVGGQARGPVLQGGFESGVGRLGIALQHGMTVGELAKYFNAVHLPAAGLKPIKDLEIVAVRGWRREMTGPDNRAAWILPSPNMPTPETATLHPGTALFEATNMSEGRGTTRPFELIGAPYVDYRWAEALNSKRLSGVTFREAYFQPTLSKNQGLVCGGVQVHITDPARVEALEVGTHMLVEAKRLYPGFDWRGDGGRWMGLLSGSARFAEQLDAGTDAATIIGSWRSELGQFVRDTREYLLYNGRR